MKKIIRNIVFCLLILSISISGLFFDSIFKSNKKVFAEELEPEQTQSQETVSIFIRQPTHTVYYNKKLYFIDEADKLMKRCDCDTENSSFDSEYLSLESFKIIDTSFIGNSWYLFVEDDETNNKVVKVDLETFSIVSEETFSIKIEKKYNSLFAQKIRFEDKDFTLILFTAEKENSKAILIDETDGTIEPALEIKLSDTSDHNDLKNSLNKTVAYQDATGKLYIIFIYNHNIAFFSVNSLDTLRDYSENGIAQLTKTLIIDTLQYNIENVSFSKINNIDYLALSLSSSNNKQRVNLYSFDFENHSNPINYETQMECNNAKWLNFNEDIFSFVDIDDNTENKILIYTKISATSGAEITFNPHRTKIKNPQYKIDYFDAHVEKNDNPEDSSKENKKEFIYKKAKTATAMYKDPWGSIPCVEISENTNVIQIGTAKIIGTDQTISDYDYCLYTYEYKDKNKNSKFVNKCGFIKTSTLEKKAELTPKDAGFKEINGNYRVAIWPRTLLYNLPTTVTIEFDEYNDDGIDVINRRKFSQIPTSEQVADNIDVYVIGMIGNYVSNDVQMIKVSVNGKIGFIDAKCIRKPSDVKNFVITNATIKNDETVVYTSANRDSATLSFKLEKGKNVRINGKRDTKTGFTSITFNDEFGNEYSGYIETDFIKSDSWSTLQIIGCILIAINIGLLILILLYKKNHLGNHGQKIDAKQ